MTGRYGHGLVIGKFYPPHAGHHHLIDRAAEHCDTVTVLVMAARTETVPLADRVAWLAGVHAGQSHVSVLGIPCDAPVDMASPTVWAAQEAAMRAALRHSGRPPVDAVFSSESYGDELAARFGAVPVPVDPARAAVPASATQVRADLAGSWDLLAGPTRAGLTTRVVVLGAESTGTTTVAERLAAHVRARGGVWRRTRCVSEYGRAYTHLKLAAARESAATGERPAPALDELVWTAADFDAVAAEQTRLEEEAAATGSPLLVCDTDALATAVWERRYLGDAARGLLPWATAALPRRDVYLLTSHQDVAWFDDGLREGDLAVRAAMTGWFADLLTAEGHSWVLLTGDLEQRVALAVRVADYLLAHRAAFGPTTTVLHPAGAAAAS